MKHGHSSKREFHFLCFENKMFREEQWLCEFHILPSEISGTTWREFSINRIN
jgi:hypothetical protein